MGTEYGRLTVFFEGPFWVGVFEKEENGRLSAAKVTFGAEPKDFEVYEFILKHYAGLKFSPAVETALKSETANPKRMQRDIQKQLHQTGTGTKSQQALKLQQEQNKQERKQQSKAQKAEEEKRLFAMKQLKKKARHRGR